MGKKKTPNPAEQVVQTAQQRYQDTLTPSPAETQFGGVTDAFQNNYNQAAERQTQDYGNIMGAYQNFRSNLARPTQFNFERVSAERPQELGEAYGYLREAAPGYREFAETGGYSPTDIQNLRTRGVSPIRAAYGNTMMELNRSRSLGGAGGSPNYIAALSRAQRGLPQQLADATTTVNAGLAQAIREGRLAGLGGLTNVGGTMGSLSSAEAGRMLQAAMANQGADLQAQQLGEASLQNRMATELASLGGESNLYGTSPGMASTFGNQALNAWQSRLGSEQARNAQGLSLLDMQLRGYGAQPQETPWWQKALGVAGTVAPFIAMSSREYKHDIKSVKSKEVSRFAKHLKELPLYTWKYKGDKIKHFGPIAEEFKEKFGIGDGKTLHLADVMGVVLAAEKESLNHA